ncbi:MULTISPECIES: hypothetical protein [Streptomyces]|uniref:hypothetical protein n=1 Tax=Streptomyces TaxID=1883 RepID=UPI002253EFE9|nr:hypothetical protein [Streptomyces virginiae]MCX5270058.1 hypothetical protein [Streptomyces virginiae]
MRRAATLLLLLVGAVLFHAATPHHVAPGAVVTAKSAVLAEDRRTSNGMHAVHSNEPASHHESAADPLAAPTRSQGGTIDDAVLEQGDDEAATALRDEALLPLTRTARDRWSPASASTPTTTSLQIFRC